MAAAYAFTGRVLACGSETFVDHKVLLSFCNKNMLFDRDPSHNLIARGTRGYNPQMTQKHFVT
jgi:hypothetical protein